MVNVQRRRLIAAAGAGVAALGAGCLDEASSDDGTTDDETDAADEESTGEGSDLPLLERWIPASGPSEVLFHYRDLAAVRSHEDALQPSVLEAVPTIPDDELGDHVGAVTDGEPSVDAVLRFGSEGTVGNAVVTGTFDSASLEGGEPAAGEFETVERDGASVAVSGDAIVVSTSDGPALSEILAAGAEGTDRRVDAAENFARLADRLADCTFAWGEYAGSGDGDGNGSAFSWTLGPETTEYSTVAVYADAAGTDEFEESMRGTDGVTVEVDGNVGVATETVPTEEYRYRDLFAERGSRSTQPRAGVSLDVDRASRTVTVTYRSGDNTDRLEVIADGEVREELTEVGTTATLEFDAGESTEITVVAANDEAERVVARESYEF